MKSIMIRFRELLNLTKNAKQQSMGMQRKLLLYWLSMVLVIFAAFLTVLSVSGTFSDSEKKLQQALNVQHNNAVLNLTGQLNRLTAQGISLSKQTSDVLSDQLFPLPISSLNNDAEKIETLERELHGHLKTALQSNPCNGAYIMLDATINTAAADAQNSCAGLYIRFANLNDKDAVDQDMTFYRGLPDIARENQIELHNRWQLEFDISNIPGAGELMRQQVNRLADSCVWTERVRLPETWEDVSILLVPILADDGSVCGLCGVELSDLYFRLSYPSQESDFGDMVTVLAPVKDGSLLLSKGMIGGTKGTYLHDEEMLTVKSGKAFNTYIGERHTFLGIQNPTDIKTVNGSEMVMVTLIPQENYLRTNRDNQMVWICSSALFLILMLLFSVFLSQKFVKPIARSIASIQTEQTLDDTPSGIAEIDALLEFVKSRSQNLEEHTLPPDIQELFDGFAVRAKQLTVTERNILKYYADGKEISEVAELACISIHTVRRHNANIYQKLEVGSREELMLYIELFARCGRLDELLQQ